jgi:hypothetical protein
MGFRASASDVSKHARLDAGSQRRTTSGHVAARTNDAAATTATTAADDSVDASAARNGRQWME